MFNALECQGSRRASPHDVRGRLGAMRAGQRLCEVPAPPFGERARAALVRDLLHATGLTNVRIEYFFTVIATVGEERTGDLRGVKALLCGDACKGESIAS
jgi:hypothetical protein